MLWQALVLEEWLKEEEGKESQGQKEGKEQQDSQESQEEGQDQEAQCQSQEVKVGQDPTPRESEEERGGLLTRLEREGQQEALEVEGLPTLGRTCPS